MSAKHTPGPWHTFRQGTKYFISQQCDEDFRFAIATVFEQAYHPDGINATRKEALANARLIASAPDLLAALEDLLSIADQYPANYVHVSIFDRARSAIAKAKGE